MNDSETKVECSDCKMVFPIMETYFNWNTGARRCWTCQVSYLEQQCQKRDEIIKVMYELLEEIYHGGFLDDRNPLLKKIEQLKKELQ